MVAAVASTVASPLLVLASTVSASSEEESECDLVTATLNGADRSCRRLRKSIALMQYLIANREMFVAAMD